MSEEFDNTSLKKVRPATIRKVVNYLAEELGLSVYGHAADLDTAQGNFGCMDYDADMVLKLRGLYMQGIELEEPKC